jgi:hypothetical protein
VAPKSPTPAPLPPEGPDGGALNEPTEPAGTDDALEQLAGSIGRLREHLRSTLELADRADEARRETAAEIDKALNQAKRQAAKKVKAAEQEAATLVAGAHEEASLIATAAQNDAAGVMDRANDQAAAIVEEARAEAAALVADGRQQAKTVLVEARRLVEGLLGEIGGDERTPPTAPQLPDTAVETVEMGIVSAEGAGGGASATRPSESGPLVRRRRWSSRRARLQEDFDASGRPLADDEYFATLRQAIHGSTTGGGVVEGA